jgi:hypothetical protein
MKLIYAAQLLLPLLLVLWILIVPPHNTLGLVVQMVASAAMLFALAHIGIWMFPPWWTPHAAAGLLAAIVAWRVWRRRPEHRLPKGVAGWAVVLVFAGLGGYATMLATRALAGAWVPQEPVVALAFPLTGGTFLVASGGTDLLVNAHRESMLSADPRFKPWRGNGHAVDLVAIDGAGLRAPGLMPADPSLYRIFGMPVRAPCAGRVIVAVDGLPDMTVPEYDRKHLAGNHVMLACGDVHVALAHLRQGSVVVRSGDAVTLGQRLGAVGNSGGSDEPHLHIHAQRPGPADAPMGGEPVPASFDGRFLVRGDRIQRH